MMRHRHLAVPVGTPITALGPAALDDLLERGDLDDWAPLAAEVRRDPFGALADRVLHLVNQHPMYGTSALWRSLILDLRGRQLPDRPVGERLRALRIAAGLTQQQVAQRLGLRQSDISKLECRRDAKVSTAEAYARACGGQLLLAGDQRGT